MYNNSFSISKGSKDKDNFLGDLKAVDVEAEVKGKKTIHHYMIKLLPATENRMQFLEEVTKDHHKNQLNYRNCTFEMELYVSNIVNKVGLLCITFGFTFT